MIQKNSSVEAKGKWLVLYKDKVILSGDDIESLLEEAEESYPRHKLVIAKAPKEGTMIY